MIHFDAEREEKQLLKYKQLREQEEEESMQMLSNKYGIPYVDLTITAIAPDALITIKEEDARAGKLAAFGRQNKKVLVAVHAPERDETRAALKKMSEAGFDPILHLASTKSLEFAWERYTDLSYTSGSTKGLLDAGSEDISALVENVRTLEDVQKAIEDTLSLNRARQTSRIVEVMLGCGLATKSSDIHIEPEETDVRVRMRLDGVLQDVAHLKADTYRLVLSRIKLLSGLKLNVANEAQDGRFSIHFKEADIEIRTSILPGNYGESIVMRILNPASIQVDITSLGMNEGLFTVVQRAIGKPTGMILTTGPTGSGKTTTLYAFLRSVHTPDVKIITIEDPVEYHLKGIVQTQVDSEKNYTFASGLRASLRQDPDIIMVGEIRDKETAEIAVHAALTGHLVFSTLHTNSASGAFTRLIDIGINPRILGSALALALAQRLVRTLCQECKQEVVLEGEERTIIERVLETVFDKNSIANVQKEKVWHAKEGGCDACNHIGYKGRIGIHEGIIMDSAMEHVVETAPSERDIKKAALPQGILTLSQDAVIKVLQGKTTIEEVSRVVDLSEL